MDDFDKSVIGWDLVTWKCALAFWEEHLPKDLSGTRSLEVGCGRGGLSLWLANKNSQVVCSDLSDPQPKAHTLHDFWGVSERIRYEAIDALSIPYEDEFDLVVFKSVLGGLGAENHIDRIQQALQQMYKALKPGGRLMFAENLNTPFHHFLRTAFVRWGRRWNYLGRDELLASLPSFSKIEYGSTGFLGALGKTEWQRDLLGEIDKLFLNRLVGPDNHYILFCVAVK